MSAIAYLIELRDPKTGNTTGYLKNIITAGTYELVLTKNPNEALRFTRRSNAESIIVDTGFRRTMGNLSVAVAEHMWMDSPVSESGESHE